MLQIAGGLLIFRMERSNRCATRVLRFFGLSERDREAMSPLPEIKRGERMELRVGGESTALPTKAAEIVKDVLGHLLRGEKVAVLGTEEELSPNEIATILGISRPLVIHRMD